MSQHDGNIGNASGAAVRADINAALQAILELNSGTSAPSPTFPNQWWADTTTSRLKRRNNANSAWLDVCALSFVFSTFGESLAAAADAAAGRTALGIGSLGAQSAAAVTLTGTVAYTGEITPTQITANQNDYSPTSLSTATVLRLSTDASRNITGLAGGAQGRIIMVDNVGSFPIVFKNADTNSTAANRFELEDDFQLDAKNSATFRYDSTASRWRAIAHSPITVLDGGEI